MFQYPFLAESLEINPFVDDISRTTNPLYARLENYCFIQGMLHFGIAGAMLVMVAYERAVKRRKPSTDYGDEGRVDSY